MRNRDEQPRITKACHADPTSGHLRFRKTLARITERFTWKGVSKDAKEIVCIHQLYLAIAYLRALLLFINRYSIVIPANMSIENCLQLYAYIGNIFK